MYHDALNNHSYDRIKEELKLILRNTTRKQAHIIIIIKILAFINSE